jgi:acetyltransferase-like isoleucine patch superfamily enzyme
MKLPASIEPFVRAARIPNWLLRNLLLRHPYFRFVKETANTQTPITLDMWITQNVRLQNSGPYWPVHPGSTVTNWRNVLAGVETSPGLMSGCYIAALDGIYIGDYTQIAPNVGIISGNHSATDNRKYELAEVRIGAYCWLGMNAVILPGVTLGDFTVVAAGAVVSKSFPEGYCVVGGVPAKLLKRIDPDACVRHRSEHEYHGYIPKAGFEEFRRKYLNV